MANDVVKLTWAADGEADEATLNLLDFVQGLTLAEGGWVPQVAVGDQSTVTETMTFRAQAMSHDQLAGYVQVLDDWIIKIGWSLDFTQKQFVWLSARWKSETNIRRAVVYSLSYSLGNEASPFGVYVRDDSFVPTLTIVIVRGAYWEDITQTQISLANVDVTGGMGYLALIGNYVAVGDVPARIGSIGLTTANAKRYMWVGFRASRNGILANFKSYWDLKDASYLFSTSSDTVTAADATTRNGVTRVQTIFAGGATLLNRISIKTSDVTANYIDQRGSFICLLRAKMSDASIARVRASSGFANNSTSYFVNPRVTVQGTSWFLYNLGVIRIPAIPRELSSIVQIAAINIDAERVSGSGNLHYDCLILIPYNDSYLETDVGIDSLAAVVKTLPDFVTTAYNITDVRESAINASGWSLPANNEAPLIVYAAQSSTAHTLGHTATIVAGIVPRWRTLRGNE